ncbi:MAG TPA: hypothetical protein VIO11_07360 [Candidatus Methanoperedens sp.]
MLLCRAWHHAVEVVDADVIVSANDAATIDVDFTTAFYASEAERIILDFNGIKLFNIAVIFQLH